MTTWDSDPEEFVKLPSMFAKEAVIECGLPVVVAYVTAHWAVALAVPVDVTADALHMVVLPSLKVTVPVGLEGTGSWLAVAEAVTVAVYVTLWPVADGLWLELRPVDVPWTSV